LSATQEKSLTPEQVVFRASGAQLKELAVGRTKLAKLARAEQARRKSPEFKAAKAARRAAQAAAKAEAGS
jgi:hypothetical protein